MALNHICIMGRATSDAELRTTAAGVNSARFSLAVDRDYSKDKAVDFFDCVAWRSTAEFAARYVKKGGSYAISGRMQSRTFETREGTKRTVFELNVENIYFAGSKVAPADPNVSADDFEELDDSDGDLPF